MNSDDQFDREVRETLERMADEPAPDRLVARVAAVPSDEAATASIGRGRPPFRGVISGLAAIAAVLALAVAALVLRPGVAPQTGDASAPPTSSVPSTGPSPVPSALVATPTPTIVPTLTPAPTTTPTAQPLAGDPVPAGFRPLSVTFVSADQGWVLGSAPCATGRCATIAHTLDGGKTWRTIPAPAAKIADGPFVDVSGSGISGIRFGDANDGWVFGPDLWVTHDGGATWKRHDPLAGGAVVALASARGTLQAVAYDGDHDYRIATTPVAGGTWTLSPLLIPIGAGPVPVIQLVLSGDRGWILENDRTVVTGARLVSGTWRAWDPPCLDVVGPAYIAASTRADLVAACDVGAWSTPEGGHLFVSHDSGVTFGGVGPRMPFQLGQAVAMPAAKTIVIAGSDLHQQVLEGSYDGGHTWTLVHGTGSDGRDLTDLGFTTVNQGVVIATAAGGSSHLLMTHDGGRTWATVHF